MVVRHWTIKAGHRHGVVPPTMGALVCVAAIVATSERKPETVQLLARR